MIFSCLLWACGGTIFTPGPGDEDGGHDGGADGGDPACDGVVCPPSDVCVDGRCQPPDACHDVYCPNPGEVCSAGVCVAGAADTDGDGYPAAEDCDDGRADVNPAATEVCNGVDDDCDGPIDEGFDADGDGHTECGGGVADRADCNDDDGAVHPDAAEVCNGVDDDCDGSVDVGFADEGAPCGSDEGDCSSGHVACTDGERVCEGEVAPRSERCDGTDADCDGLTGCGDRDCDGTTCDGSGRTCRDGSCRSMCDGSTFSGYGCGDCPAGSFEVYCPGPGCSRACNTDGGCDNRYKHSSTDSWIDHAEAFCFSGTHEANTYWEMR